jgi:hypothetical protein
VVTLFFLWALGETRRDAAAARLDPPTPGSAPWAGAVAEPVLERPWWETEGYTRRRTDEYQPRR